ncbi:MAG: hypothetical protein H7Y60_00775 [Rhodospirillaceae bacterium]|nr:hypothetical protein [Rhodospirillales bacterium]
MTYQYRRQRAAAIIRSQELGDRRLYNRFPECGIVVRLGQQLLDVYDLSIGGLRVPLCGQKPGTSVKLQLIPREGRKLSMHQTVSAQAEIISECESWSRLHFVGMTYSLAKFLIQYMARRHGVQPFIFK